jgi:hypothetical protein
MKKAKHNVVNELRSEYKRSDFGRLVRGKYSARAGRETNIIVLEPDIAEAFPNDAAVNKALRGLLDLAKKTARPRKRSSERDKKRRVG